MKINNINLEKLKKISRAFTLSTLIGVSTITLTGCNLDLIDTNKTFDKAIIVGDGIVTIYDIKQYKPYSTERYQLKLPDDTYLMTSTVTTRFVNTKTSNIDIEEFAKTLVPDDYEIKYIKEEDLKGMQKTK